MIIAGCIVINSMVILWWKMHRRCGLNLISQKESFVEYHDELVFGADILGIVAQFSLIALTLPFNLIGGYLQNHRGEAMGNLSTPCFLSF
jgi:hypothetical protein